jgi:hypothetical protein
VERLEQPEFRVADPVEYVADALERIAGGR